MPDFAYDGVRLHVGAIRAMCGVAAQFNPQPDRSRVRILYTVDFCQKTIRGNPLNLCFFLLWHILCIPKYPVRKFRHSKRFEGIVNMSLKMKLLGAVAVAALAVAVIMPTKADAHTVAIGWSLGASAGQVNLFMGSYHNDNTGDGPNVEGSAHLTGPNAYDTNSAFTTSYAISNALPANLLAADINWYTGYTLSSINSWEAVTITGLVDAGTYNFDYVCGAGCSAHWSPRETSTSFTLSSADIGGGGTNVADATGVPEPASMAILGLGLIGISAVRRKFS